MLGKIRNIYQEGIRNLLVDFFPYIMQVIYIGVVIDTIVVTYTLKKNTAVFAVMFLIHVLSMYILAFLTKANGNINEATIFSKIYYVINICVIILTAIITKSLISIVILIAPIIITIIISILVFAFENLVFKISKNILVLSEIGICILLLILFSIPILNLPINAIGKIIIIGLYIISIPFIVVTAKNEMNFYVFINLDFNK